MTGKELVGLGAILAVGALATYGVVSELEAKDAVLAKDAPPAKVLEAQGASEAVALADGGIGYVGIVTISARTKDGGTEWLELRTAIPLDAAPCVRRRADAGSPLECLTRTEDGGTRDPGALNRFPASLAVGAKCQPVACAVTAGENADGEEAELPRVKAARAKPVEALPVENLGP